MKKGSQFDEGLSGVTNSLLMQGTPTVPFGDYMNGGTTPLRDRADTQQHNMPSASKFSVSNNMQRAVSSEQKGIHAVSGAFNQISINSGAIPSDSRNQGMPHPQVDEGRFTARIPREIRNDPEIVAKLEQLDQASRAFMHFDMPRFQNEMNRELESNISKLNQEFKNH